MLKPDGFSESEQDLCTGAGGIARPGEYLSGASSEPQRPSPFREEGCAREAGFGFPFAIFRGTLPGENVLYWQHTREDRRPNGARDIEDRSVGSL